MHNWRIPPYGRNDGSRDNKKGREIPPYGRNDGCCDKNKNGREIPPYGRNDGSCDNKKGKESSCGFAATALSLFYPL